tara:strand:+ start:6820 stop:7431 length:612 start_codon:yes stop_codon:yes gene_type:complete
MSIIRNNPEYKRRVCHQARYKEKNFEKLNDMINDLAFMNNYQKWKDGINFKTNKNIKIGGDTHKKLDCFYQYIRGFGRVYIDDMININQEDYLKETIEIVKDISNKNKEIHKYNDIVKSVIDKIKNLEKWDEFVEFEGKCYGLVNKVKNDIHIENDCNGKMIFIETKREIVCRDRPFCYTPDTDYEYDVYECSNCKLIYNKYK